ncbi:MAG: undecaprenyl-diphosphate phosphatase [Bacteroidales bacterium]|nr:undecaprenyl-diphosphate phosphatase [Bacteroidales bacterium]
MSWWQALLLGLIQGLTEFLPVSSSGHLELGKALLNVDITENLLFTVVVHIATVLSTIVVFRKEIGKLFVGFFSKGKNDEKSFVWKLLLSAVPVAIVGFLFKDYVDELFDGRIILVGCMLLVTAAFLTISYFVKKGDREINWLDALIIGVGQAVAVMPGLSRSGTTIATGMMIGNKPSVLAKFSFLMVIIPVLGEMFLDLVGGDIATAAGSIGTIPLLVGFLAAFLSGLFACKWMIRIVSKGKLIWFAVYCVVIGIIAIICGL